MYLSFYLFLFALAVSSCKKENSIVTPTGITVSQNTFSMVVGSIDTLTASVSPSNATVKTVDWKSTNTSVVKVDQMGIVTGIAPGNASIIATTKDGNLSATCLVTVIIPTTGITLSKTSLSLGIGSTAALSANLVPSNATNNSIIWESSNTDVATVNSSGTVTGIANGSVNITASIDQGNFKANCTVTVNQLYNDLIAYYKFDGNTNDESSNSNNGIYHGRMAYTSDRNSSTNSALDLNGSTDYVEIPNSISLNPINQLTISLWLEIDTFMNRYTAFIDKGGPTTNDFTNREYLGYFNDQRGIFRIIW
jgi:uncharacterized protein YjdB